MKMNNKYDQKNQYGPTKEKGAIKIDKICILTATSTKSFGRLNLRIEPEKVRPSQERAAEASSGVRNSKRAWPFSLCICSKDIV